MLKKLMIYGLLFSMSVILFACGAGVKNGFVKQNGQTYYYVDDVMKTGWQQINGDWYYFYESDYVDGEMKGKGTMKCNTWLKDGNAWYFFVSDGKLLKNSWLNDDDTGARYYMGADGKMVVNTVLEIGGDLYVFDANGVGKQKPAYNLIINSTLPRSFDSYYGAVTIENIDVEWDAWTDGTHGKFVTKWTGTCGYPTRYYLNTSCSRSVGWKLYDPDGYVIDTGTFYTDDMVYGDKFRDKKCSIGYNLCNRKGDYRLDIMNSR